jgi:hypothetical protein
MRRSAVLALLCAFGALGAALPCAAGEARPAPAFEWSLARAVADRPGLAGAAEEEAPFLAMIAEEGGEVRTGGRSIAPAFAGLLSALVPGTGQLAQGQRRGWFYLGAEVVSIFSAVALRSAGNQAEEDYQQYADAHWAWVRYETATSCGDGLGPVNFELERDQLRAVYESARDQYYEDIGRLNIYACGWDALDHRGEYEGMRSDADGLFSASRYAITAMFLNHVVSAVDAAKSASNRRHRDESQALRMGWSASPRGDLALRVELARSF